MDYMENYRRWLSSDSLTKEEKEELQKMDEATIQDCFYRDLEFGTGGMRGVMGLGPNRMNRFIITKATLGFARYLLDNEKDAKNRGVVIAHDNRYNGDEFTKATSDVLTSLGIRVYIFDALRTTPELSFAVRYLNACGGINITASHNPKHYNGYKIYNSDGNQLILEQSNIVMDNIAKIDNELAIRLTPDNSKVVMLDNKVDEAFYKMVIDTSLNKDVNHHGLKIVYTPQHGTGYVPVTTILNRLGYDLTEVKEQCYPYHDFRNTKSPNPENKEAYELALEYAKKVNADLIIANDPDCDRIGIVCFDKDRNPIYLTGNQAAAILIKYILDYKKEHNVLPKNGIIYNTIVTSPLGGLIAKDYGVSLGQTLTGFKYIGDRIKKDTDYTFLMGYEESYGYLFNQQVRDKDGVQAATLISEMAAYYKDHGYTLADIYEQIQQKYGYFAEVQASFYKEGEEGAKIIASMLEAQRNGNIAEIAGEKVVTKEDYLLSYAITDGKKIPLDFEKSNVIRYLFEDGSFVCIRPSGTEPKIKYYFALKGKTKEEANARLSKMQNYFLK